MNKVAFVAWQDPQTRSWYPVGRLSYDGELYRFTYTRGATVSPLFIPFARMNDFQAMYESVALFPVFANRVLQKSRPEYGDLLQWRNLTPETADEIEILARSGGLKRTDSLEIFPCPDPAVDGSFQIHFFCRGIRYLPAAFQEYIKSSVNIGDRLVPMRDSKNPHDPLALALRTEASPVLVGYLPRYLTSDPHQVLDACQSVDITVEAINREAPLQFLLLCNVDACWPDSFSPCSSELYEPLASEPAHQSR